MLVCQSCWDLAALVDTFTYSLAAYVTEALLAHDPPPSLDGVIDLAIRVD